MYLVILLAAAAILGGVVVVSMGGGGELALFDRDSPVRITRLGSPGEVANLQLPFGLLGYQARATGEALIAAASLLARRDAEIAALRREIWRLGGDDELDVFEASSTELVDPEFAEPDLVGPGFDDPASYAVSSSAAARSELAGQSFAGQPFAVPSCAGSSSAEQPDPGAAGDPAEEAPVVPELGLDQAGSPELAGGPGPAGQRSSDDEQGEAGHEDQIGES